MKKKKKYLNIYKVTGIGACCMEHRHCTDFGQLCLFQSNEQIVITLKNNAIEEDFLNIYFLKCPFSLFLLEITVCSWVEKGIFDYSVCYVSRAPPLCGSTQC